MHELVLSEISSSTGIPSSRFEKKQTINSWQHYALCDAVLSYARNQLTMMCDVNIL